MKTIFITAAGGEIANPVIKSLRLMDEEVRIIGADISPYSCGLYQVDKAYIVPRASDITNYEKALVNIIKNEKVDLLIPGSDTELPIISKINDRKALPCEAVVPSNKVVQTTFNKLKTYEFFKEYNLPFVTTVKINQINDLISKCGFPIIAKPISGSGSQGIKIFFNKEEFQAYMDADIIPEEYIYQELITNLDKAIIKKEDFIINKRIIQRNEISTQMYVSKKGNILGTFSSINALKDGMPVYVKTERLPDLENEVKEMVYKLAAIGLKGPVNLQSKLTKDGFKVFEINTRYTGITGSRSTIGYNECEAALLEYIYNKDEEYISKKCLNVDYTKSIFRHYDDVVTDKDNVIDLEKMLESKGDIA